jgi:predicted membrane chloride channel (bestrophin family)
MPSLRARRATDALAPEFVGRIMRSSLVLLGGVIVLAGILVAPLPGPGGIPVIALGLVVVLRNSYKAKRWFLRAQRRWPKVVHPIRRLMRREPEIASVFWQQYLRVERFTVPKRYRLGVRAHRHLKRQFRSGEA